jgi:hypothetical protein
VELGFFIVEISYSDTPNPIGLLWKSSLIATKNRYLKIHRIHERHTSIIPVDSIPQPPTSQRPQTLALHSMATGSLGRCIYNSKDEDIS